MKLSPDQPDFNYEKFNKQVVKTETAGKLLNYYGDLIQKIEYVIKVNSIIKKMPERLEDVPVFKNLINNRYYTNIFNIKLNNIHKLSEEIQEGLIYLEKLTLNNRSKWLKKNFKDQLKLFKPTYKELVFKSYFDMKDKNTPIKYDVIFNFNGVNPNNEGLFNKINSLSKEKINEDELMQILQEFINITNTPNIKDLDKAQLLDLVEEKKYNFTKLSLLNSVNEYDNNYKYRNDYEIQVEPDTKYIPIKTKIIIGTTLLKEAKRYYPRIQYNIETHKYCFAKPKICYTQQELFEKIIINKIKKIIDVVYKKGLYYYNASKSTLSDYFIINGVRFRVSDHRRKDSIPDKKYSVNCYDIRIFWNTDVNDVIETIIRLSNQTKEINETIHPSEANNDEKALQTLIDGRRKTAFVSLRDDQINLLQNKGFWISPKIQQDGYGYRFNQYVVSKDKEKGQQLLDIINKNGGYADDQTPEEARLIGNLLEYDPQAIEDYIARRMNIENDYAYKYLKPYEYHTIDKENFKDALLDLATLDLEDGQVGYPKIEGRRENHFFGDNNYDLYILDRTSLPVAGPFELIIKNNNDEIIGFIRGTNKDKIISFNLIHIKENHRGFGIGTDIYEKFLNYGFIIKSDKEITDDTYSMYLRLINYGYQPIIFNDKRVGIKK